MHVLVTGGTGFIGRALSLRLLSRRHQVTVLTRDPPRAQGLLPAATCVDSLFDIQTPVDAVFNLAGENLSAGRWTPARKVLFRSSRIDLTHKLVSWMGGLDSRPEVLINGSAIGYYASDDSAMLTEASPPGRDFAARLCQDWEAQAMRAAELGIRVCCVRTGVVLGPHGGALRAMLPAFRLGIGGPMGNGQQFMSWIDLEDHINLMLWLFDHKTLSGAYNATAPSPIRNADFARSLGSALHRPALLRMPSPALKLLFGEMSTLMLGSQRVMPERALQAGFTFSYPDLAASLAHVLAIENGTSDGA